MPRSSVWGIRIALIHFLMGISIGAMLLITKAYPSMPFLWYLRPLHIEFLLVGWIVQLVMSVGYWIFPRYRFKPKRGNEGLVWFSIGLLQVGIIFVAITPFTDYELFNLWGRTLELLSVALFLGFIFGRVKPTETGRKSQV